MSDEPKRYDPTEPYSLPKELWIKLRDDGTRGVQMWDFQPWKKEDEAACGVAHKFIPFEDFEKLRAENERLNAENRELQLRVSCNKHNLMVARNTLKTADSALAAIDAVLNKGETL